MLNIPPSFCFSIRLNFSSKFFRNRPKTLLSNLIGPSYQCRYKVDFSRTTSSSRPCVLFTANEWTEEDGDKYWDLVKDRLLVAKVTSTFVFHY